MAKRKQRRRRAKERRHDYEYVYVDDEGREVEVEEPAAPAKNGKAPAKGSDQAIVRGGRKVEPPTWRRTLRRAALFAPLMLVVVYLLQGSQRNVAAAVLQALVLMALFIPFSYFMDSMMYRSVQRRAARGKTQAKRDSGR
jgi:TRAP-type uncharacterized transport system fused permease subunit